MEEYFAGGYTGDPFILFSGSHFAVLGIITGISLLIFLLRNRMTKTHRHIFRFSIAVLLIVNETAFHLWNLSCGTWTYQSMLPLHLCSIMVFTSALMLLTGNYTLYEFVYFLGIGGAVQALITPNIGIYGFPHFRFFQTFIAHGCIVFSAIYMTAVEGYRPYLRSLLKVVFVTVIYMVIVTILNLSIGSNYMYTAHKLETPTLLDFLGPWPWYIPVMAAIGLALCSLLYAPFLVRDALKGRSNTRSK